MRFLKQTLVFLFLMMWTFPGFAQEKENKPSENKPQARYTYQRDVVYGHKDGMALTFDVVKPLKNANGAGILWMISGGWFSSWTPPEKLEGMYNHLTEKGFTVFLVRHGSAPKYKVPDAIEDVRRAVRFIRKTAANYGVDPERLGVTGASAGGHLSLMLGTASDPGDPKAEDEVLRQSDRVACVVAYFGPTDLRPWVKEGTKMSTDFPALLFEEKKALDCSPLLQVSKDDAPTLLLHGDKDTLVPLDHSEKILDAFKKAEVPCDLIVIKGAGHGFEGDDDRHAREATVAWFEKYLVPKK
ncbi:MAG TPA: alpha/beta hydrolase [Candidatus Sumerlaeota bacterium]|nr:alpha/beta hydrolase [Candidatus Sumerlaeota bacterium]